MSCPFSLLDEEPLLHVSVPLIQVHPVRPPRQPGLQLALPGQRFGQLACFENQPPTPLAAPPRTGLAAFGVAWRMLLPEELSSVCGVRWLKTISNF